jgi:threonine/homoserine/homoserine lactone efflux protein
MDFKSLLMLSLICAMGAISPGPSLALILRNTIAGGRFQGAMTGVGHGIGLVIYAFIAVLGLSKLVLSNEYIFKSIQIMGIILLFWFAYKMFTSKPSSTNQDKDSLQSKGFMEGFLISFFNPKILVFFVAVFSQFISDDLSLYERMVMATVAGVIDMAWYVLVALLLAESKIIKSFRKNAAAIDRCVGWVLGAFAIALTIDIIGINLFN